MLAVSQDATIVARQRHTEREEISRRQGTADRLFYSDHVLQMKPGGNSDLTHHMCRKVGRERGIFWVALCGQYAGYSHRFIGKSTRRKLRAISLSNPSRRNRELGYNDCSRMELLSRPLQSRPGVVLVGHSNSRES